MNKSLLILFKKIIYIKFIKNRCVHEFNNISQKNIAPDFYYRPNAINKKITLAKKMINILNANK